MYNGECKLGSIYWIMYNGECILELYGSMYCTLYSRVECGIFFGGSDRTGQLTKGQA